VVVLGLAIAAAGCYEAAFPLDATPQADIDARVAGTWRCVAAQPDVDPDEDTTITLVVKRARDRVYDVTLEEEGREPDRYVAHASLVKGQPVINLRAVKPYTAAKPWAFARYSLLRADVLAIAVAQDDAFKGVPASQAAVRKVLEGPQVFEGCCVCARRKG
jgi:hypothetical protein